MRRWSEPLDWPTVQLRAGIETRHGRPVAFVFQLEHNARPAYDRESEWHPVARMDHDEDGPHDVRKEGLHMDIYDQNQRKLGQIRSFPDVTITEAPRFCERFFRQRWAELIERFENDWPTYRSSSKR